MLTPKDPCVVEDTFLNNIWLAVARMRTTLIWVGPIIGEFTRMLET